MSYAKVDGSDQAHVHNLEIASNEHQAHAGSEIAKLKRRVRLLFVFLFVLILVVISLSAVIANLKATSPASSSSSPSPSSSSSSLIQADLLAQIHASVNKTIDPCIDFYSHVCSGWLSSTVLPSDSVSWSRSFSVIQSRNLDLLYNISAREQWPVLSAFYEACANVAEGGEIERRGAEPLREFLSEIEGLSNLEAIANLTASLYSTLGTQLFFSFDIGADSRNSSRNVIMLSQGGLSLRGKGYYEDPSGPLFNAFTSHIVNMFTLLNSASPPLPLPSSTSPSSSPSFSPSLSGAAISLFESSLANISQYPSDLRDPVLTYNARTVVDLEKQWPEWPWRTYLTKLLRASKRSEREDGTIGIDDDSDVNDGDIDEDRLTILIESPSYFTRLRSLLSVTPLSVLRMYALWHVVNSASPYLSSAYRDEHFAFFGKIFLGQKQQKPRWKQCLGFADEYLGDILGRYYVASAFPGSSKSIAQSIVADIKEAFVDNLKENKWMDQQSKDKARIKLDLIEDLIGYPSTWTDYSSVFIQRDRFFENLVGLRRLDFALGIERLSRPPSKQEWAMSPPTVNAYYDPTLNTINFPAGILQPPFFNQHYPMAVNMAGIGMVMGHEITHGFDDQGSQYDGNGMLNSWWDNATATSFDERAQCLVKQYSAFPISFAPSSSAFSSSSSSVPSLNGALTLGENIADNGGIREAFRALHAYYEKYGEEPQIHAEITNDQLFFLSYGLDWCQLISPSYGAYLLLNDPHSPAHARVNLPLANFPKFAEAFQCAIGTPMNPKPENKCQVW